MDFRVVHPIPLTVADVMAEFHVLDALGHGERGGSEHPAGLAAAAGDDQPRGDVEASLKRDSALDVCPVFFTARILDVAADRLQLASERLEVRIAQMGVFGYVCYCHRRLTDIQAKWRAAFAGRRTSSWDSTAPTSWSRPFLVVVSVGWVSVVGEGCGQAGEQHIEAAVEFGGAVVGG